MSRHTPTLKDFRLRETCILESALNEMKLIQRHHPDLAEMAGLRWGMLSTQNPITRQLLIEEARSKGASMEMLRTTAIQFSNVNLLKDLCMIEPLDWKTAKVEFLAHEERVKHESGIAFMEHEQANFLFEQERILSNSPTLLEFALAQNSPALMAALFDQTFPAPITSAVKIQGALLPSLTDQEGYSPLGLAFAMGAEQVAEAWIAAHGWPTSPQEIQPLLLASCVGFAEKNLPSRWVSETLKRGAKWGRTEMGFQPSFNRVFYSPMTVKFLQNGTLPHSVEQDLILGGIIAHSDPVPAKRMQAWLKVWLAQSPNLAEELWQLEPSFNQRGFKQSYSLIAEHLKLEDSQSFLTTTMLTDLLENIRENELDTDRFARIKALRTTHPHLVDCFSVEDFHAWLKQLRQGGELTEFTWREEKTWTYLKEVSNALSIQDASLRLTLLDHLEEILKVKSLASKEQEKLFWETPPSPTKKMKKTL